MIRVHPLRPGRGGVLRASDCDQGGRVPQPPGGRAARVHRHHCRRPHEGQIRDWPERRLCQGLQWWWWWKQRRIWRGCQTRCLLRLAKGYVQPWRQLPVLAWRGQRWRVWCRLWRQRWRLRRTQRRIWWERRWIRRPQRRIWWERRRLRRPQRRIWWIRRTTTQWCIRRERRRLRWRTQSRRIWWKQ